MYGTSVPNASECMNTRTWASAPCSLSVCRIDDSTTARFSASAAFVLKKTARRPSASTSATTRCALGSVERRSRWTPKTFMPLRASSTAAAAPNPLDAPRMSAHS